MVMLISIMYKLLDQRKEKSMTIIINAVLNCLRYPTVDVLKPHYY